MCGPQCMMWLSGEVRSACMSRLHGADTSAEKWLQAVKALNKLAKLERESPLLHVRLIDMRSRCECPAARRTFVTPN